MLEVYVKEKILNNNNKFSENLLPILIKSFIFILE